MGTVTVSGNAFSVGGTTLSVIGGNVGVGITSPLELLHVFGSGAGQILRTRIESTSTTGYAEVRVVSDSGDARFGTSGSGTSTPGVAYINNFANTDFMLGTNNLERLRISAAGNLGIGTSTPQSLLDVNGMAQFGSGMNKSTFTVAGGLFVAAGSSVTLSGANGFVTSASSVTASAFFGDGSHLTGVAAGGGAVLTATQTFSGANTFGSTTTISGQLVIGNSTDPNPLNTSGGMAIWAKSSDGATVSSGCVVAVNISTQANSQMQFTSTTTILTIVETQVIPGVLLQTCAPASICLVGIKGIYRVPVGTGTTNQYAAFATTRCGIGPDNSFDAAGIGGILSGNAVAGNKAWINLR